MRPVEDEQEEDNFGGDDGEEFVLVLGAWCSSCWPASQGPDSTGWSTGTGMGAVAAAGLGV